MESLKQIANVAGYPGLYRILKPGRAGVIVETLDDKKEKTMMGAQARVSVLSEISMYVDGTGGSDESKPLGDVLKLVEARFGDDLPVNPKSDGPYLVDFMAEVMPDYDRDRVRVSDIKKLVSWYLILRQYAPELFVVEAEEAAPTATAEEGTPAVADEEPQITEEPGAEAEVQEADETVLATEESAVDSVSEKEEK
jgi:Domain of unknown function (DUF5606)